MSIIRLSLAYLTAKPLGSLLNLLLLSLGIATITVLLLFGKQFQSRVISDASGIDLVVGAKGSPLQLILSAIYHADTPTGNIPLSFGEQLRKQPIVKAVVPMALGDNVQGFRIVGTETSYAALYGAKPAEGKFWLTPFEAVLGANVARATGLKTGDSFHGTHGLETGGSQHEADEYRVVGVLGPTGTVIDRLVLTSLDSVWFEHDPSRNPLLARRAQTERALSHADLQVTALLVQYASPLAAVLLPRQINTASAFQAAAPAQEITRLLELVGIGLDTLQGFGLLLVFAAALGVLIALYNAMQERRYDLAIMRALGGSPATLLLQVLCEALLLSLAGALLGLAIGHGVIELLGRLLPEARQMGLTGLVFAVEELWLVALALGVGLAAALVPAIQAYRTDIAAALAGR